MEIHSEMYNFLMALPAGFAADFVRSWNSCHGAFYRFSEAALRWSIEEQTWLRYFLEEKSGVPFLCAVATDEGHRAGISAKTLWVSAYGSWQRESQKEIGVWLDGLATKHGKTRLYLGGEEFHLLPGVPEPDPLAELALDLGFQAVDAVDYAGKLDKPEIRSYIDSAKEVAKNGWTLEQAGSPADLDELGAYLKEEFKGRWEREFRFWRERQDTRRAFWNMLRHHGRLCGFSRLAVRGEGGGWLPGALKMPLLPASGESTRDASLGPIGVSLSERGKGAGRVLLGLSLQILLDCKAEQLCIDWTNAYNYYIPLGLPVVRKYRSAWKDY